MFLNLICIFSLQAQTITVGTGDDEPNDPDLTHQPFGNRFSYERSAGIYLSSEIGRSGTITAIGWFLEATNNPAGSVPSQIYLKQTSITTFTGNEFAPTELSGATLVWSGNITAGQLVPGSWLTITLTTPFVYNNASNLEVITATNTTNTSGAPTGLEPNANAKDFRFTNINAQRFIYWQRDDMPPGTSPFQDTPFGTPLYRANIQLTFGGAPLTCAAPTTVNGSGTGQTTAQVTFSGGDTSTSYIIEYGPTASFPAGTTTTTASSSPANLTGLTAGTNYSFVVRTVCSNGITSSNSPTGTFATTAAPQTCDAPTNLSASNITSSSATLSFTASTTGAPGTYTVQYGLPGFANGAGTTVSGPPYTISGLNPSTTYEFTVQKNCGGSGTSIVRSQFTTLAAQPQPCTAPTNLNASNITSTSASLNFTASTTGATGTYTVEYGPSGFTQGNGTVLNGITTSQVNVNNLNSNTAYQFYVTKNCGGASGNSTTAGPANFSTTTAPVTCNAPTNLSAINVTNNTADLSFTPSAGAGTYIVEYGLNGFTPGTGTTVTTSTSPVSVNNLVSDTTYQFYVTKNCGSGVFSSQAGPATFSTPGITPIGCTPPATLTASNIGTTSASLGFSPVTAGGTYTLEYGPTGFTPGNGTVVAGLATSPYNATNLLPGITYDFYVTKNCTGGINSAAAGPETFTTLLTPPVCNAGTWLGITSTNWNTASNWCNNTVPDINTDVTIPAIALFQPEITTNANARNLTIQNGATLTLTSGVLTVSGLFTNNGTLNSSGGGSMVFTNSNANLQTVGKPGSTTIFRNLTAGPGGIALGGPVSIRELLTLNGNLTTNGQTFTLLSEPSNQAMVINNSGAVIGTATVKRYINPGVNPGPGYRHLSSPVTSAAIGQLNDANVNMVVNPAYNTNPTPGTTRPYPTVFRYNETRLTPANPAFTFGWESPSSLSDPMPPGRGFTVNMLPTTLDISGTLNNGSVPVGTLTRGSTINSGWHLLGNPYPAPIDWDQVTVPAGVDNAVYVFRSTGQYSGTYNSYVNGVGAPGTELIAVMQGFFVRVNSGAPSFTFNNSARVTTYQNPALFRQTNTETRPLIALSVQDNAGAGDQLHVYFENGATPNFDSEYDAFKLPNSGNVASFYSVAGNEILSINGLPVQIPGTVIPLGGYVPQAGTYTITADQIINFNLNQQIYLEDRSTGTLHNLRQQTSYQFNTTQTDLTGRFFLRFSPATTTGITAANLATEILVYPNPNKGVFTISMPVFNSATTKASLFNAVGQQVWQQDLISDNKQHLQTTVKLDKLAAGVYTLRLETAAGPIQRKIVIE